MRKKHFLCMLLCLWVLLIVAPEKVSASSEKDELCAVLIENASDLKMDKYLSSEAILGDWAADAMLDFAGSDIAALTSGEIAPYLHPGAITEEEIDNLFPIDSAMVTVQVTGHELFRMLETGLVDLTVTNYATIDHVTSKSMCYPQISGITVRYDVSALPGERIYKISLSDGTEIKRDSYVEYELVSTEKALHDWGYNGDMTDTGLSLRECIKDWLKKTNELSIPPQKRQYVRGAENESTLFQTHISMSTLAVAAIGFSLAGLSKYKKLLSFDLLSKVLPKRESQ